MVRSSVVSRCSGAVLLTSERLAGRRSGAPVNASSVVVRFGRRPGGSPCSGLPETRSRQHTGDTDQASL